MSKQPDKELREAIAEIVKQAKGVKSNSGEGWSGFTYLTDPKQDVTALEALFTKAQLQLVDELMEQKVPVTTHFKGEIPVRFDAVPITTIEKYKANLSGKGE